MNCAIRLRVFSYLGGLGPAKSKTNKKGKNQCRQNIEQSDTLPCFVHRGEDGFDFVFVGFFFTSRPGLGSVGLRTMCKSPTMAFADSGTAGNGLAVRTASTAEASNFLSPDDFSTRTLDTRPERSSCMRKTTLRPCTIVSGSCHTAMIRLSTLSR
jgi:hypothetical protein